MGYGANEKKTLGDSDECGIGGQRFAVKKTREWDAFGVAAGSEERPPGYL